MVQLFVSISNKIKGKNASFQLQETAGYLRFLAVTHLTKQGVYTCVTSRAITKR